MISAAEDVDERRTTKLKNVVTNEIPRLQFLMKSLPRNIVATLVPQAKSLL
jgi:hypothetical protein